MSSSNAKRWLADTVATWCKVLTGWDLLLALRCLLKGCTQLCWCIVVSTLLRRQVQARSPRSLEPHGSRLLVSSNPCTTWKPLLVKNWMKSYFSETMWRWTPPRFEPVRFLREVEPIPHWFVPGSKGSREGSYPITFSCTSEFLGPRNVAPTKWSWHLANGSWRLLVANLHRNLMMRFLPVTYWPPFKLGHLATLMVLSDGRKLEKTGLAKASSGWWSSIPVQSSHAKGVKVAQQAHSS